MSNFITSTNVSFVLPLNFFGSLNLNQLTLSYQCNINHCLQNMPKPELDALKDLEPG